MQQLGAIAPCKYIHFLRVSRFEFVCLRMMLRELCLSTRNLRRAGRQRSCADLPDGDHEQHHIRSEWPSRAKSLTSLCEVATFCSHLSSSIVQVRRICESTASNNFNLIEHVTFKCRDTGSIFLLAAIHIVRSNRILVQRPPTPPLSRFHSRLFRSSLHIIVPISQVALPASA